MNNNQVAETDFDLGLSISSDPITDNLFKEFHEAQSKDNKTNQQQPADGADKGTEDDDPEGTGTKAAATVTKPKPATTPATATQQPDKKDVLPVDGNAILDMLKQSGVGSTTTKTTTNADGTTSASAAATDKGSAAADNISPLLTTIYEHLTTDLGLPSLPEGETFDGKDETFDGWFQSVVEEQGIQLANDMIVQAFANQKHNEPLAKDFFKFIATTGGNVEDFLETRRHDAITADYLTTTDEDLKEARSEKVLRDMHNSMGWDQAATDKYIASLKKSGQLETVAETALPQVIKANATKKAQADQQALVNKQKSDAEVTAMNNGIISTIDSAKEFMGFNLATAKEKEALKQYMYARTVDMGNGIKVPQFMADKIQAAKNPQYTILQALTLKNKGLDLDNINNKAGNKAKLSLKERLEANASGLKIEQPSSGVAQSKAAAAQTENVYDFDNLSFTS